MAIDRDGTVGVLIDAVNVPTQMTIGQMQSLNNESNDGVGTGDFVNMAFIFPELRDVDGYLFIRSAYGSITVYTSVNTTNGIDGTWVQIQAPYVPPVTVVPQYREQIRSSTALGIRSIRFTGNVNNSPFNMAVHLYGEISPAQNPNRLVLWHPTLDQRVTPSFFDWGDVPRSSSADKTFRVKNLSATLSANSIRVAQDVLTDTTPSVPGQHTLSTDGTTFLAQVNVGTLAPGAISAITTLRRVTPSNAVLSLWAHRVFAEANSWS